MVLEFNLSRRLGSRVYAGQLFKFFLHLIVVLVYISVVHYSRVEICGVTKIGYDTYNQYVISICNMCCLFLIFHNIKKNEFRCC